MKSAFSQAGWEYVYDLRAAVQEGDVGRVRELAQAADDEVATQVGVMTPSLLALYTGLYPDDATVLITARVLHRHLNRYDVDAKMKVADFVEIVTSILHGTDTPTWLDAPAFMCALVGFLMPEGEAEVRMRADLEPLWARTMEAP